MMKQNKANKNPWYKRKGYLHFDLSLDLQEAARYVKKPSNIVTHKFSPLIYYQLVGRKVKRDRVAEAAWKENGRPHDEKPKLIVKSKPRNIFYASHIDGYIFSYYAHTIQKAYNSHLARVGLSDAVLAYRAIERAGTKCSNIHFAKQAFDFIAEQDKCNVSCFDLSKFFDKLDPVVLKENWALVLNKSSLPSDHKVVFKQLTNFSFVDELDLIKHYKSNFATSPRKHGFDKSVGGSSVRHVCDYRELRKLHQQYKINGKKLIQSKDKLGISGVAQGTSISGLLANIFMLKFDIAFNKLIADTGGLYLRYSDDLFVAYPDSISYEVMHERLRSMLKKYCGETIKINEDKTEDHYFERLSDGSVTITSPDKTIAQRIQYLGFHYSADDIHIRNSSISKDRGKTIQAITKSKLKKSHGKIDTRTVYKNKSHRQVTSWNPLKHKGFINYALRSARIFENSVSIKAQIQKNDNFIRKAVKRVRDQIERRKNNMKSD